MHVGQDHLQLIALSILDPYDEPANFLDMVVPMECSSTTTVDSTGKQLMEPWQACL